MSLERIHGDVVFTCDACDGTLETKTGDFGDARIELKDAGWKTAKAGDAWVHRCTSCQPARWWETV
jgi:hypothetical protein